MQLGLTVRAAGAGETDVVVDADPDTAVRQLAEALGRCVGVTPEGLWLGATRLDDNVPLCDTAVRAGAVVALTAAAADPAFHPPTRGWVLHVISGEAAGTMIELPVGVHELGRSAAVPLRDRTVSRRHAALHVTPDGAAIIDLGSANGTTVDGEPVPVRCAGRLAENPPGEASGGQPKPVATGQLMALGDTLLTIAAATPSDAAVEPGPDGDLELNRPPRLLPSTRTARIQIPAEPTARERRRIPVIAMLAPLVLGVLMAVLVRQPLYLMFALMSPVMLLGNTISDRRHGAKADRRARADYVAALADAQKSTAAALAEETQRRRDEHPDAAEVVRIATLPTRRLWERRRIDPDALVVRVGTADLPSRLELVTGGGKEPEHRKVCAVPALAPLRDVGVLGIAGPRDAARGVARWLTAQLAVHHAPRDVSLVVLAPHDGASWQFVRWLPHARPADHDAPAAVGSEAGTVATRVSELLNVIKARQEIAGASRIDRTTFPAIVVVLDGARALRGQPGVATVLADGPAVGVFAVCIEAEDRLLPEECSATLLLAPDDPTRLSLRRGGEDPVEGVLVEQLDEPVALTVARALAPLRDVSTDEDDSALPDSARLLDILALDPPTPDAVRTRWQLEGRTTRIPVGIGTDGSFALDLRRDGPHGLIAGTTGAGKSELLQSIIASLAVGNRPDALNFVLVDYKGGSAFKDCVTLPHTVGMVTDLDAHLVERALLSLSAELRRREHQLATAGVKDLEDYEERARKDPALPPLPRLLLVIDEFASMARELPDFVSGLVGIAQRGRSLGIHLLLATQRPSGVVSPEIRANTNLRISLRVTDAADSGDVIEAPDAARIAKSTPGRALARLGHGALLPFQTGRVGGRRPGARAISTRPPYVAKVGWRQLGYPVPRPAATAAFEDVEITDLSVLVSAIREAAAAAGLGEQRAPWLPPLPAALLVAEVPDAPGVADLAAVPFGLVDLPEAQQQRPLTFDLARDGHLLVVGSPRSGRSQLLRTLAGAAATRIGTADLHLFGIDCGNGALLPLAELPHTGAIVSRSQPHRAIRLLARLSAELERRQAAFAEGGYADITEQRRAVPDAERLPHLMLLVDRWEGFLSTLGELDSGRLTDTVLAMMREGGSVGVHVLITGDRSLASGRISSLTDNKLVLRLADRGDYSLLGLNPRKLPDEIPPGRGFAADTATEAQIALLAGDTSGQGQAAALGEIAAAARQRDGAAPRWRRPFRVDVVPSRVSFAEAWEMREAAAAGELFGLVGVGGDELAALGPDLSGTPAFVVGGPNRSGRSTLLASIVESIRRAGGQVVVGAPRPSPLHRLTGAAGVLDVITDAAAGQERWRSALEAGGKGPVVVVLDDAEALRDSPAGELFRSVVRGLLPGRSLVLCGHLDGICTGLSGWQVDAKKARCGLLLSPQSMTDGDLIGVRLPRSAAGAAVTAGRGLLHLGDGQVHNVAIPFDAVSVLTSRGGLPVIRPADRLTA